LVRRGPRLRKEPEMEEPMVSIYALPPLMLGIAAGVIAISAVTGLGIALIRGIAAFCILTRGRMPASVRRWYRALAPMQRHTYDHDWRDAD